mmetsp:Transcript_4963/g.7969  ORF Transcript_4963/g.7969 Transcript_4963/m.7969 type:complete len:192 (-) Transcript_4963:148-723(-)
MLRSLPAGLLAFALLLALHSSVDAFHLPLAAPLARTARGLAPQRPKTGVVHPGCSLHRLRASAVGTGAANAEKDGLVEKITAEELEFTLQDTTEPLIVDFYTEWCGPCKLLAPQLKMAAIELKDKVKVVKIDTDENPELATAMNVYALPTMLFINNGEIIKRHEGPLTVQKLMKATEHAFFDGPEPDFWQE